MKALEKHFYTPTDIQVMDLDQIYLTSSAFLETGFANVWATFDLLVRDMPRHRNFLVFTGLEEMIRGIIGWGYSSRHVRLLQKHHLISSTFASYLRTFRFSGTVYGMQEGTLFFPGEPVLRITAPIIEANLLTAFLITSLSSNTTYASKYIRSVLAAKGISVIGTSPNRATSFEHAFKSQRSAHIVGSNNTPSPITREKLGMPLGDTATIAYHAFIKAYPTELEAMRAAAKSAQIDLSLMIDTYSFKEGLQSAIIVGKELRDKRKKLKIVIDSGDLLSRCRYTRKELDRAGLFDVRITLAGNLDEYKIDRLVKAHAPANTFIVATEAQTSSDDPRLEAVYKLSEIIRGKKTNYTMKLSEGKVSLPGRKQVFRIKNSDGYVRDIIGLEGEKLGKPLLQPMIIRGKQVYMLPTVRDIRSYVAHQIQELPNKFKEVGREYRYLVLRSKKLKILIRSVRMDHLRQYQKKNVIYPFPNV